MKAENIYIKHKRISDYVHFILIRGLSCIKFLHLFLILFILIFCRISNSVETTQEKERGLDFLEVPVDPSYFRKVDSMSIVGNMYREREPRNFVGLERRGSNATRLIR